MDIPKNSNFPTGCVKPISTLSFYAFTGKCQRKKLKSLPGMRTGRNRGQIGILQVSSQRDNRFPLAQAVFSAADTPFILLYNKCYHDKYVVSMKISLRMLLFALLLAAICYTVYNWVIGAIDASAAVLYILALCFSIIRWLSAFVKHLKDDPE